MQNMVRARMGMHNYAQLCHYAASPFVMQFPMVDYSSIGMFVSNGYDHQMIQLYGVQYPTLSATCY